MEWFGRLLQAAPRATLVVLVEVAVVVAVLALLGPAIFLRNREPFSRLMEFLKLVLGANRPAE